MGLSRDKNNEEKQTKAPIVPTPIFDSYDQFRMLSFANPFSETTPSIEHQIFELESQGVNCRDDYKYAVQFLLLHSRKSEQTYNSFRTEVERLLLWAWKIKKKIINELKRADYEEYIDFCMNPPREWVSSDRQVHFFEVQGERQPNKNWKPFRVDSEQSSSRANIKRKPAQATLVKLFSTISVFLDHLIMEGYSENNPIPIVKKHSPYLIRDAHIREVHRLSELQWDFVLDTLMKKAEEDPRFERNLFALVMMKSCYLRVSELAERDDWQPIMGHFQKKMGYVWISIFGKGRKLRSVSVPDEMIPFLIRYRKHRGLSEWPEANEQEPLIHKLKGQGGPSIRQITRLIEDSFEISINKMIEDGFRDDAIELKEATSHWLRHTGASMDVKTRPLKHLADDLGHASLSTTDRIYVQSDDLERAESGRKRKV